VGTQEVCHSGATGAVYGNIAVVPEPPRRSDYHPIGDVAPAAAAQR
jgi:hypothetical protein